MLVNGRRASPDQALAAGDELEFHRPPWREPDAPESFAVAFEDDDVLVVVKPAGLQVLPAGPFSARTLLKLVRASDVSRAAAAPAHRLGRGTSGLIAFGKTAIGRSSLTRELRELTLGKTYLAWVAGARLPDSFAARQPIARVPHGPLTIHAAAASGRASLTRVRVLRRAGERTLVAAQPITGRPDQIRIHLAAAGAPIVGDQLFGPGGVPVSDVPPGTGGYLLHAAACRSRSRRPEPESKCARGRNGWRKLMRVGFTHRGDGRVHMSAATVWQRLVAAAAAGCALAACDAERGAERGGASGASFRVQAVAFPGGAGSAQARFASGADGTPILSWLEPVGDDGVALRFAAYAGGTFTAPPREVTSGDDLFVNWADVPSVQPITAELWAAHWLKLAPDSAGAYHVATAVSADGGRSWTAPVQLNDDSAAAEHGFVELFAWDGKIAAFWLDGRQLAEWSFDDPDALLGTSLRVAELDGSGAVVAREIVDELVCDCCQPNHAMTRSGPVVAYRDRTPEEIRDIVVRRYSAGRWQEPVAAGADGWHIEGCPVNGPAIAAAGERVGVAWFTAAGDRPRVRFAWSTDGAASFAPALELDGAGSFGQLGLVLEDDGSALVTWWRAAPNGGTDLVLRAVGVDGALGELRVVAHSTAAQPIDVPQMIAAGDDVLVAWTSLDEPATVNVVLVQD